MSKSRWAQRVLRALPSLSAGARAVGAVVGAIAFAGWIFDVPVMKSVVPGALPLKTNTALCLLLLGVALELLDGRWASRWTRLLATVMLVVVTAVGGLTLFEYASGWSGIDELLISESSPEQFTSYPNRMSLIAAISFLLLGIAGLGQQDRVRNQRVIRALPFVAFGINLVLLFAHAYHVETMLDFASSTRISQVSAVTLMVLSLATIAANPPVWLQRILESSDIDDVLLRRTLPVAVVVPIIVGWLRVAGERAGLIGSDAGVAMMTAVTITGVSGVLVWSARNWARMERQRHEVLQALQAQEAKLERIVDASVDGIVVIGDDDRLVLANPAVETMFGLARAENLGRLYPYVDWNVWSLDGALLSASERPIGLALRTGRPYTGIRVRFQSADGQERVGLVNVTPIVLPGGSDAGVVAVIRDITDLMRHEQELQRARDEAEAASRAKSEFLSRMSHELRTPLNAILGFAQVLEIELDEPQALDAVAHILNGGQHLLRLVDEVLEINQIESGGLRLTVEPVDVGDVVREAVELILPAARQRGVTIATPEPGTRVRVLADRQRLVQVLLNLLSNGIKYNHPGGRVAIRTDTEAGDGRTRIIVEDSGIGLRPAQLERMFQPFERLGAENGYVEGTGLGLVLSRGLVEAMGGTMGVFSVYGEGSTFWVELRALPAAAPVSSAVTPTHGRDGRSARRGAAVSKVLCIEDSLANLKLIERLLASRPGIEVLAAMQGSIGLELALQHAPDIILLDLQLPDISGEEVLQQLQADPRTASTPVIVISADATPRQVERLYVAGARAYLTKPIQVRQFLALVEELLGQVDQAAVPGR